MELINHPILIGFGVLVAESILLGLGTWCLVLVEVDHFTTYEREYMRVNICRDSEIDLPCTQFVPAPPLYKCDCKLDLKLEQDLKGPVTLYYEIEFDQTNVTYASSKDDQQLLGVPGDRPAEACGRFSYDIFNKPIFPCGEVADSIFNDTYTLLRFNESSRMEKSVPVEYTNLLTGRVSKFKNPPLEVLKNFSPPINWNRDPSDELSWEAETNLIGVENPAFQAWMDTSLRRKPVWRVQMKDQYLNGLPAGNYSFFIQMHYGVNRYSGPRTLILEGLHTEKASRSLGWGVFLLLLASVVAIVIVIVAREHSPYKTKNVLENGTTIVVEPALVYSKRVS